MSQSLESESAFSASAVFDYEFAREELTMKELMNDPIACAVAQLEKQHREDKQDALDRQRVVYEEQLAALRNHLSPMSPIDSIGSIGWGAMAPVLCTPNGGTPCANGFAASTPMGRAPATRSIVRCRYDQWAQERYVEWK